MNKLGFLLTLFLIIGISSVTACYCGPVKLTDSSGNQIGNYSVGQSVYLTGNGFEVPYYTNHPCSWRILRNGDEIVNGSISADANGNMSKVIYTTSSQDIGKEMIFLMKCDYCGTKEEFRVFDYQVPEFGTMAALIALVGSVAVFIVIRKKH